MTAAERTALEMLASSWMKMLPDMKRNGLHRDALLVQRSCAADLTGMLSTITNTKPLEVIIIKRSRKEWNRNSKTPRS